MNFMTNLRLRRCFPRFGPAMFALSLCFAVLAGVLPAPGTTRSRTRRPLPALEPLRYTEHSFAFPRGRKAGSRPSNSTRSASKADTEASSRPAHSHQIQSQGQGSHRHGHGAHSREAQPAEIVPMHRTSHPAGRRSGPTLDQFADIRQQRGRRGRRIPLPAPDPDPDAMDPLVVAEVIGRSAHGDYLARLHGKSSRPHPGTSASNSGRQVIIAEGSYHPYNAPHSGDPALIERRPDPTVAWSHSPYSSGTSHPEGSSSPADPRFASAAPTPPHATLPAITATVQSPGPAPLARPNQLPTQRPSQLVSGFGSEVALAPSPDRVPVTRRRNHPIPPSASPEDRQTALAPAPSPTLAEREAITAAAVSPAILPDIYDRDGHLLMPAALRGSRENLIHQNFMADSDGLERISNDTQLNHLRATHQLIDLPAGPGLRINDNLPYNRRCARPWTALFVQDLSRDFYARFHQPLWLTSAVRTVAFQSHLIRVNGNAAGLSGDFASPHLTGQAIDFGKRGMSAAELAWMRSYLLPLIESGKIDVEEEFQQACFHISVYRRYAGGRRVLSQTLQVASQATPSSDPPLHSPPTPSPGPIQPPNNPDTTDIDR